jgi:hypothetical protein
MSFFVPRHVFDEDFVDLALVEIDMPKALTPDFAQTTLIDLAPASGEWLSRAEATELWVIGYPEEHSFVDYEQELLVNNRFALPARYVGPSSARHLHEAEVIDTHLLSTFSGFSGAPVFAYFESPGRRPEVVLCGMALRATVNSRRLHFLDRSVLIDALNVKLGLTVESLGQ